MEIEFFFFLVEVFQLYEFHQTNINMTNANLRGLTVATVVELS